MRRGLTRKQKGRGCGCGGMEMLGFPKTGGFTSLFGGEEEESTEGGQKRYKQPKMNISTQSSPVIPAQESSPVIPDGEGLPDATGQSGESLPAAVGQSGEVLPDATTQIGEVGSSSSILPSSQEMRKDIQQKQQKQQKQQQQKQQKQKEERQERQMLSVKPSQGPPRRMPNKPTMDEPMDNISPEMNSDAPMKKSRASISRKSIQQGIPSFEQAAPYIQKELTTMRQDINILKAQISTIKSSSGGPSRGLFGGRRKTLRRIRKHRG